MAAIKGNKVVKRRLMLRELIGDVEGGERRRLREEGKTNRSEGRRVSESHTDKNKALRGKCSYLRARLRKKKQERREEKGRRTRFTAKEVTCVW